MLYDQRRKRGRQAMAVAPRPPQPQLTTTPTESTVRVTAPLVRAHAATQRFLEALPLHTHQQPVWTASARPARALPGPVTTTAEPVAESAPEDVRKMIRQAHRARKLLLDRLTVVNLRRSQRCDLLEEITRLKKVLASLQEQVDTTTRNVARMDRLVLHLQTISSIFTDAIEAPAAAAAPPPLDLTLDAAEEDEEQRRASESSQSPRATWPLQAVVANVQVGELVEDTDELEDKTDQPEVEGGESSEKKNENESVENAEAVDDSAEEGEAQTLFGEEVEEEASRATAA